MRGMEHRFIVTSISELQEVKLDWAAKQRHGALSAVSSHAAGLFNRKRTDFLEKR